VTKLCRKCGREKPISGKAENLGFYTNRKSKDGFHAICKVCWNERGRTTYEARKKLKDDLLMAFACGDSHPALATLAKRLISLEERLAALEAPKAMGVGV
jgi:hypothetical protein